MCGRFTLRTPATGIAETLGLEPLPLFEPRFNICPTQPVLVVRSGEAGRAWGHLRWGLVPSWSRDPSGAAKLINARGETVADKPSFRAAFKRRRCLIPADGYYEWQKLPRGKQAFHIHLPTEAPFAFAGLWETWHGEDGTELETCTIITTAANDPLRPIHDRMPVVLDPSDFDLWLDPAQQDRAQLEPLLHAAPPDRFVPVAIPADDAANWWRRAH